MNLKQRARRGDRAPLETMFRQFLPDDERIEDTAFLGLKGMLGLGSYSFAAVTDRRVASLQLSMFGGATYRDGYHEHINSSFVSQPSRLPEAIAAFFGGLLWLTGLYGIVLAKLNAALATVVIPAWLGLGLALVPLVARVVYRFLKSGLVLVVREGVHVYCFADRKRLGVANQLACVATEARDRRLAAVHPTSGPGLAASRERAAYAGTAERSVDDGPSRVAVAFRRVPVAAVTWFAIAQLEIGLVRLVGFTRDLYQGNRQDALSPELRWWFVLPTAVVMFAAWFAAVGQRSARDVGVTALLGSSLVVGLQGLWSAGWIGNGAPDPGAGMWFHLATAVLTAVCGVATWAAWSGAMTSRPHTEPRRLLLPMVLAVLASGFVVVTGSLMPWYAGVRVVTRLPTGEDRVVTIADRLWGLIPDLHSADEVVFVVATALCLAVPAAALAVARRRAGAGLLLGWGLALGGWALGAPASRGWIAATLDSAALRRLVPADPTVNVADLRDSLASAPLRYGFRLFEVGVVVTVVVAAALFATTVQHRVRLERAETDPRWAPPAAAPMEEQPV